MSFKVVLVFLILVILIIGGFLAVKQLGLVPGVGKNTTQGIVKSSNFTSLEFIENSFILNSITLSARFKSLSPNSLAIVGSNGEVYEVPLASGFAIYNKSNIVVTEAELAGRVDQDIKVVLQRDDAGVYRATNAYLD